MEKFSHVGFMVGATFIFFFLALGLGIDTGSTTPDYAKVVVDMKNKVYYSPVYLENHPYLKKDDFQMMTAGQARGMNFMPDKECREQGCFYQKEGVILWKWLDDVGIYKRKINSKWNPDGSWNY